MWCCPWSATGLELSLMSSFCLLTRVGRGDALANLCPVLGLPRWLSGKESACQFDPWVRKIPWRRTWQPTPIFSPGESHTQRSLVGYSPWGRKGSDRTEHMRKYAYCPAFRQISTSSQLLLAQDNPYAKMAYFGVAYSTTLQMPLKGHALFSCPHSSLNSLCLSPIGIQL